SIEQPTTLVTEAHYGVSLQYSIRKVSNSNSEVPLQTAHRHVRNRLYSYGTRLFPNEPE
ncbi:hypothetical protein J6590_062864, partial [Homalodisca vitripennis]